MGAELGRRAWDWLVRHGDAFFAGGGPELVRVKRLAELALVTGTLADELPGASALLARAWVAVDRGEAIERLLPTSPVAAASYLPFRLAGLRSPELDRALAAPDWRADHARWPAFGRLAVGVVLENIGCDPPWDQGAVVAASGMLSPPTRASSALPAAFLAHAVMWRTDMGRNPCRVGPRTTTLVRELSRAWQPLLAGAALLDPLGELVVADLCLGGAATPEALTLLAAAQRPDGAVPARPGAEATFDAVYHTTIVAALAGTLASRPARPRPTDFATMFAE